MTLRRSLAAQSLLLAASVALSLACASRLPDQVVTHWNLHGQPDGWGSKWTTLLLVPAVQLAFLGLTPLLPMLSPKEFRIERFGSTYAWIFAAFGGLMTATHVVLVLKTAGAGFDVGRALLLALFAFWIVLGNVIGRVKRNFYVGIRTPWTLADDRVWHATHRAAGRLWVGGGLLGLLAVLAGAPVALLIAFLIVIALVPVAQSFFVYKSLSH